MRQICNECGRSVAPGSGFYVNRTPDFNSVKTRKRMGKAFPEGDFICSACEDKRDEEREKEDEQITFSKV